MLSDWDETPAHYLRLNFAPLFEPLDSIEEVFFSFLMLFFWPLVLFIHL